MNFQPRPTQQQMYDFVMAREASAVWATMGAGKSAAAAHAAVDKMFDTFEVSRWLIAAPKMTAEITWPNEFAKWDALKKFKVHYVSASDFELSPGAIVVRDGVEMEILYTEVKKGEKVLRKTALALPDRRGSKKGILTHRERFTVVSYEFLAWLRRACGVNWPYDGVIADESVFLKNHQTARTTALRTARKKGYVRQLVELTGGPQPNGEEDLFSQMLLLDGGRIMGKSLTEFRQKWCFPLTTGRNGQVYKWAVKPELKDRLRQEIAKLAISVTHNIGIPLVEVDHLIELPTAALLAYNDLEQQLLHRFDPDSVVLAPNRAVLANKLLQIAQGAIYDQNRLVQVVHDEKLKKLEELMQCTDGPMVVAYPYAHDWLRLSQRFGKHAAKVSPAAVGDFRAGRLKLLCTHPLSLAFGVDGLQEVSNSVVWFGMTYAADSYYQLNARLHRPGQEQDTVYVHRILADDTIEMDVANIVIPNKIAEEQALLAAVRARSR